MQECLKEWQTRLFLDDWIIKVELVDKCKNSDGIECAGTNQAFYTSKACAIKIKKPDAQDKDSLEKVCHEETLIHELLHCKYNWVEIDYGQSISAAYYDISEHALIEQMAKSLLMAKYGMKFDWFKNF